MQDSEEQLERLDRRRCIATRIDLYAAANEEAWYISDSQTLSFALELTGLQRNIVQIGSAFALLFGKNSTKLCTPNPNASFVRSVSVLLREGIFSFCISYICLFYLFSIGQSYYCS